MADLISIQAQNWFFDYLIDPSFQGINRFFVLLFEIYEHRKSTTHNNKLILV